MPDVFRSGVRIPEFNGVVRGGPTMVMHSPDDLRVAQALCSLLEASDAPLHGLYSLLNSRTVEGYGELLWEIGSARYADWREVGENQIRHSATALNALLGFTRDVWTRQDSADLNVALAVARPEDPYESRLEITSSNPMLVFHPGSLLASVTSGTFTTVGYALMVMRGGAAASQRAERILERTRAAVAGYPGTEPLDRIDELPRLALRDTAAVVIFLPGLLSTDVGTFDSFIRRLRVDQSAHHIALVGWPHDTLAGIDANAQQLRRLLEHVVGPDGPPVAFVCHSRGGLLARRTAVELYEKDQRWLSQLRGCVTFGTPHEGCPLAEIPEDLIGKAVALLAWRGSRGLLSLADAIEYAQLSRSARGIEDLRPTMGGGGFLSDLLEREARFAAAGDERALDVFAIGGAAQQQGIVAWLCKRALAGQENDLVVETRSSMSRFFTHRAKTQSDHFSYLDEGEEAKPHFSHAVRFVVESLGMRVDRSEHATVGETVTPATVLLDGQSARVTRPSTYWVKPPASKEEL